MIVVGITLLFVGLRFVVVGLRFWIFGWLKMWISDYLILRNIFCY